MNTTTELEAIRTCTAKFTWGTVLKIHDIGPYTLVEYKDHLADRIRFHIYISGKSTNTSSNTFEGAVLLAIAYKNLESNNYARFMAIGAGKLLGVEED